MKKKVEEEKEGDFESVFDLYFQRIGKPIPILPADHHFPVDSLPSQPLSLSVSHRLLFLAHASSGFCVARTTDVMDAVKAQGGGRSVRDVCLADVAVASGVRILSVSHDGSTLAAASFSHIVHFFSVPSLLDEDETPFFTCSIDPLSTIKSLEWRKMTSHLSFLLLSHQRIEDALHLYCVPENLEGYRSSATGKNMQRNVMTKTDASSLSQDLVDEIFLRASPTSLAKFKVLSKYYNSMISSPKFITTNLQLQTSKSLILTSSEDQRSMSLTILGSPDDLLEHIDLDNLEIAFDGGPLVGSANGLVCMRERSNDFVVLNPATKQYKRIPYRSRKFVPHNVGFGYHEDFKLVVIPKRLERMPVQVFSLTKGTWRKVRFQVERSNNRGLSLDRYAPASISVKSAPKVINGVWYRILAEDEQFVLLSFDLKDEYPAWTRIDANISYTSYLELGHYNVKNLCLYAIDRWFQSKEGLNQFDMWVMELGGLWTKMFTTNLIAPPIRSSLRTCYRLRGTWRGSPAILRYDYFGSDRSICVFSPFTHCWRRVDGEFPNCCVLDACEYYGSLLPLSTSALGQELQVNS